MVSTSEQGLDGRGRDWHHDDSAVRAANIDLPDVVVDLADIAHRAFMVDRSSPRGAPDRGEGLMGDWSRTLRLVVPVRRSDVWSDDDVRTALTELLCWLTDDDWQVVPIPRHWTSPSQAPLFDPAPPDDVALFSGGLDAVAGTALTLMQGATLTGVSVVGSPRMRAYQSRTARDLHDSSGGRFRHVAVPLRRVDAPPCEEPSRRTRGLVFLASGIAAAVAAGRDRLLLFENGVGAINLPYVEGQRGSMTSRAVHPRTLALASRLAGLLLGRSFSFHNPCLASTKGEMVACLDPVYAQACRVSQSCDGAVARRGPGRCGACTSCLLRRVSVHAAGRQDWDGAPYATDVLEHGAAGSRLPQMLWQAHRLDQALQETDPLSGLRRTFPELDAVLGTHVLPASELVRLYSAHVDEWRRFPQADVSAFLPPVESGRRSA